MNKMSKISNFEKFNERKKYLMNQIIGSIKSRFLNSNTHSIDLNIKPSDQDDINRIFMEDSLVLLELDDYSMNLDQEDNIDVLLEILYKVEQAIPLPLNHKGKYPNELVEYKMPVSKVFFEYTKTNDETKLIYELTEIQNRAISELGDGTLWFKFSKDDTLATDINEIRKNHHINVYGSDNLHFLREKIRSAVSLEGELFVYFDKNP